MAFRRMSRSTNAALVCLWLIAGLVATLQAVTQFTTLHRAPSAAPALRSRMVGRHGQAAAAQASTTRFAKNKDDADEDGGGGEKEAFSPTAVVMHIPYFGLFAAAGATVAAKAIGAFAEQFETKPAGKK